MNPVDCRQHPTSPSSSTAGGSAPCAMDSCEPSTSTSCNNDVGAPPVSSIEHRGSDCVSESHSKPINVQMFPTKPLLTTCYCNEYCQSNTARQPKQGKYPSMGSNPANRLMTFPPTLITGGGIGDYQLVESYVPPSVEAWNGFNASTGFLPYTNRHTPKGTSRRYHKFGNRYNRSNTQSYYNANHINPYSSYAKQYCKANQLLPNQCIPKPILVQPFADSLCSNGVCVAGPNRAPPPPAGEWWPVCRLSEQAHPSASAVAESINSSVAPLLSDNDAYICYAYSSQCYILQKVSAHQCTVCSVALR